MKKIFTLLFSLVATTALWAEDFEVDGIYYNILADKTNEVEVTYQYLWTEGNYASLTTVTIPETLTHNGTTYSVTTIGYAAFYGCSSLTSITIPNSVTEIGDDAFRYCDGLPVENNLRYADTYLVEAVDKTLSTYSIKEGTKWIGSSAFEGCSGLTSITIPNSVTSIGSYAFYQCSSLTSVTLGSSVTTIGYAAFSGCSGLTSVTIPNSVTSIGNWAFEDCSGLVYPVYNAHCFAYMPTSYKGAYIIPEGIKQIAGSAFYLCTGLTSITIPNSVTSIGDAAFASCSSLTSVTIPNSVTSIGGEVFAECSGLTSVTIPNSVTSIGGYAFYGCYSLPVENNLRYADTYLVEAVDKTLSTYSIKEGTKWIGSSAFSGCSSLTSITIPNSITSIGDEAFRECSGLTSITIPNSVTSIEYSAFRDCTGLTSIESLAEVPPTLGSYAFLNVSTTIPVYVCAVSAYQSAYGWKDFTNIQEPLVEYSIAVGVNDSIMGTSKVDYNTYCEGNQISATAKLGYHFVQWSDGNTDNPRTLELTQDTILTAEFALTLSGQCGDNLYWQYAASTISITGFGSMWDDVPWRLFKDSVVTIDIANGATTISDSAFANCKKLNKLTLPASIEEIGANAFAGCNRLYDIYVYATYPPFAEESSFANYNVYLYIPCENQRDYILDIVWGKFKFIECIGAESENMGGDSVVINTGSTDVTITWPTEENADTYSIVIKKDGKVVCTLTFNSEGQLLNIAFAPGREGNHPAQYAEATTNGYRFTVTGLEEGTDYTYTVTSKDAANKTISEHSGKFTTNSTTALDNTHSQSANCQKLFRDGHLLIIRDGKTYNAQGVEL